MFKSAFGNNKLSRNEEKECRQRQKEIDLINKRINCKSDLKIKEILVGDSSVGKTSLIQKFVDDRADIRRTMTTVVCDFHHCTMHLTGKSVTIRIWDTAGQERFQESDIVKSFYRNSHGVLLVFSVDDYESFQALPRWLERAKQNIGSNQFDCCIVGNKSDQEKSRMVSRAEAERFSYHMGFPYIETSALDSVNVRKAFIDLTLAVLRRQEMMQQLSNNGTQQKDNTIELSRKRDEKAGENSRCRCTS